MLYTTWGPIRGDCGHLHRSIRAAQSCAERDARGCRSQGGYGDRALRIVESRQELTTYDVTRGPGRRLTEHESAWAEDFGH